MHHLLPGPPPRRSLPDAVTRIRTDYLAMPSLHLTLPQVLRLWSLDETTGVALLAVLTETGFLRRTPAGGYVLADGAAEPTSPAWHADVRGLQLAPSPGEVPCTS